MKTDFFITYHHSDEMAAWWTAGVLKEAHFSVLMDSWDFLPGEQPHEKIEHTMSVSHYTLVLLSGRFFQSGVDAVSWQAVRKTYSIGDSKKLILLRTDSCDVERGLGASAYIDLYRIKERKKEMEARKRLLDAVSVGAPSVDIKESAPISDLTRGEILEKRKSKMDDLLKTTIKQNYHMKLALEMEVEKEVVIENEDTGKIEKRREWVWEAVSLKSVLQDRNNYILVNPSGMGKTTFLIHAACTHLDRARDYSFMPIFTTCIALNNREGSIENFITTQVESLYKNSQTAIVDKEWQNLCVLIDALDQARDIDDIVSSLQVYDKYHYYKKAKIILSSRENTAGKVKEGFKKIRLKLPGTDEVRHYLGEQNYKKLEGHITASSELVTVPVLLQMLKIITEKGHVTSKLHSRAGLYTEFTRILIDQERNKPRFWQDSPSIHHFIDYELEKALEKIAFFSLVDNEILEIQKEKLVKYCESPEKKEALLNTGIILEFFEDWEQKIVFRHQSFQAYFAARYMYHRRPDLFRQLTSDICFFYSDVWYEVMRFYVVLEKKPQKAEAIIDKIYQTDDEKIDLKQALRLIFAFFLMSERWVSREFIMKLYKQLGDLLINNNQYLYCFITNIDKFNKSNDEQRENIRDLFSNLFSEVKK